MERRYLEDPPTVAELEEVLNRLGLEPWEIVRTGEPIAKELGISSWVREPANRSQWIEALAEHPKLIQRPIITASDNTTLVARDEQSLNTVIAAEQL